jgi:hypothetical protein
LRPPSAHAASVSASRQFTLRNPESQIPNPKPQPHAFPPLGFGFWVLGFGF